MCGPVPPFILQTMKRAQCVCRGINEYAVSKKKWERVGGEKSSFDLFKNKNDYGRIRSGHIIPFGDSQDIISFHCFIVT